MCVVCGLGVKHCKKTQLVSVCVCRCVCQVDPRRLAKADKAKARGNDAFKQGKYR